VECVLVGGISNPLTVIEQITYLLFTKRLDEIHTGRERRANRLGDGGPCMREDFKQTYGDKPLGELIRWIVGLDRKAAKEAFAEFLAEGILSADQIKFIDQIIEHLIRNGVMNLEALYEPLFTDIHYEGLDGVLPDDADKIISIINRVNENACAA
jgi:type I restriction enzyme R subunit